MSYSQYEIMHTAIKILDRRSKQMDERDDELYHYGRKGMKWGEDIFSQEEMRKRAGAPGTSSETGKQKALRLRKEALLRKADKLHPGGGLSEVFSRYSGTSDYTDSQRYKQKGATQDFFTGDWRQDDARNTKMEKFHDKKERAAYARTAAAIIKEGKAPYKQSGYGPTSDNQSIKAVQNREKYGGIGKGSEYANAKIAEKAKEDQEQKEKRERQLKSKLTDYSVDRVGSTVLKNLENDRMFNQWLRTRDPFQKELVYQNALKKMNDDIDRRFTGVPEDDPDALQIKTRCKTLAKNELDNTLRNIEDGHLLIENKEYETVEPETVEPETNIFERILKGKKG